MVMGAVEPLADENARRADNYVPVIDIAPYIKGGAVAKQRIAEQIGKACQEIGFYIIVGHGVSSTLTNRLDQAARDFSTYRLMRR